MSKVCIKLRGGNIVSIRTLNSKKRGFGGRARQLLAPAEEKFSLSCRSFVCLLNQTSYCIKLWGHAVPYCPNITGGLCSILIQIQASVFDVHAIGR